MYKLDDGSYDAASLGSILTTAASDWIESNRREIYSVETIQTQLYGNYGMVTIRYHLKGTLV